MVVSGYRAKIKCVGRLVFFFTGSAPCVVFSTAFLLLFHFFSSWSEKPPEVLGPIERIGQVR